MNKTLVTALCGFAAGLALWTGCGRRGPEFTTEPITRGDVTTAVTATGTVNAVTTVNVGTQVSGRIQSIDVDYNSRVKKGEVIAQIDPALFEAQVAQAKANLSNARANLDKAEATLADAKRTRDRYQELFARDLVARSELDTAETNYATDAASVAAAKTQIDQAAAALALAETNLHYTKIVSPVDGVVISRNVDVGQTVAASFQTPTLFVIAADLTKMQIDTSVDEADISGIKPGQDVEFSVDAYPDETFRGTVSQVRNAAVTVQNVVTYDVVVTVDNKDLKLKPGMTAEVSIITAVARGVLRIPDAALRFRPCENGRPLPGGPGPAVWVLENGKPVRVPVTVGISDGTYSELLSGDLKEGQPVITESLVQSRRRGAGPRFF